MTLFCPVVAYYFKGNQVHSYYNADVPIDADLSLVLSDAAFIAPDNRFAQCKQTHVVVVLWPAQCKQTHVALPPHLG